MTAQAFRQLETSLGFRHWPTGLLCDQALRAYVHPTKIIQYDLLHVYFCALVCHTLRTNARCTWAMSRALSLTIAHWLVATCRCIEHVLPNYVTRTPTNIATLSFLHSRPQEWRNHKTLSSVQHLGCPVNTAKRHAFLSFSHCE
jgi:hypothetical protein